MNKKKVIAKVISQRKIGEGIYDMWIETDLAEDAGAGQFICVYPRDKSTLLPRPISICEADRANGELRIVYRVAGKGTEEFSHYAAGEDIGILGCLGNGFPLKAAEGKKVFLMGGGIGIPPMVQLAKDLRAEGKAAEVKVIAGYRDGQLFLKEDMEKYADVYVATEDGSVGTKGNVLDAIRENGLSAEMIFACGPAPMLRALKAYAGERGIPAWISMEERMACGIGACLACVCGSREVDGHSHVKNKRICKDGPVFLAEEVEL